MPAFPRDEMEEMARRWVAANDEAGRMQSEFDWFTTITDIEA